MKKPTNAIDSLARRVEHGDPDARREFQETLRNNFVHIVRWTLQAGSSSHPLAPHIFAEARSLAPAADPAEHWESLYRPVSQSLCDRILDRMSPGATTTDLLFDTVLN